MGSNHTPQLSTALTQLENIDLADVGMPFPRKGLPPERKVPVGVWLKSTRPSWVWFCSMPNDQLPSTFQNVLGAFFRNAITHATLRRAPRGRPDLAGCLPRCVRADGRVKLCGETVPTLDEPHTFVQWVPSMRSGVSSLRNKGRAFRGGRLAREWR